MYSLYSFVTIHRFHLSFTNKWLRSFWFVMQLMYLSSKRLLWHSPRTIFMTCWKYFKQEVVEPMFQKYQFEYCFTSIQVHMSPYFYKLHMHSKKRFSSSFNFISQGVEHKDLFWSEIYRKHKQWSLGSWDSLGHACLIGLKPCLAHR